jgi:mRNA-degrading endonuclease RelE of RelBE toxin-antitoxin system
MTETQSNKINIEFTLEFKRNIKFLIKKYRSIKSDIQPIIEELQNGNIIGDQVKGLKAPIYKIRVKNSDINKGKSAGYRILYYLKKNDLIILLTIFSKSDQGDIKNEEIQKIIKHDIII